MLSLCCMITIPLYNSNKVTFIDDADLELVSIYKWNLATCDSKTYAYTWTNKMNLYLHRYLLGLTKYGYVDHIDRNGLNNQRNNLRLCSASQNGANQVKKRKSSSQYKGVYWDKKREKWIAGIGFRNKELYLGGFNLEIDAAKAYDKKAKELFGEFAITNFEIV